MNVWRHEQRWLHTGNMCGRKRLACSTSGRTAAVYSPASRAAAWAESATFRISAIVPAPVCAHARTASIAARGRLSPGYLSSNEGSTRPAQSAARIATVLWSVLVASSSLDVSMLLTANFLFFMALHSSLNHHPLVSSVRGRRHSLMYVYPP